MRQKMWFKLESYAVSITSRVGNAVFDYANKMILVSVLR